MRTPWGYDVSEQLDPIISTDDFNEITGNAYANNPRVESALNAASQAIRNYCGWHVVPSASCTAEPTAEGCMLRLPAAYVSAIASVTEDNEAVTDYEWRKDGLIRRATEWTDKWGGISVTYTAGYSADAVQDLAEAVCAITAGVLSVTAGVMSESADGVSISYSTNAASIAAALTYQQTNALEAYRVRGSHAA